MEFIFLNLFTVHSTPRLCMFVSGIQGVFWGALQCCYGIHNESILPRPSQTTLLSDPVLSPRLIRGPVWLCHNWLGQLQSTLTPLDQKLWWASHSDWIHIFFLVMIRVLYCPFSTAGVDYNSTATEFIFERAPQQACVQINITNDDLEEQNESFLVLLNTTVTSRTVSLNPQFVFVTITGECL